jgi:hypothetical protein
MYASRFVFDFVASKDQFLYNSKFSTCFIYSLPFWNDVMKWIWLKFGSWLYGYQMYHANVNGRTTLPTQKHACDRVSCDSRDLIVLYSFHALIESSFSLWRWHIKNPNHINVSYLCLCLTFSQIHSFHSKSTLIVDWIGFDNILKKLHLPYGSLEVRTQSHVIWSLNFIQIIGYGTL